MAKSVSESPVWPMVAVKDLARARKFYEEVLGYEPMPGMTGDWGATYPGADGTGLSIYQSDDNAGTNKATYAVWKVDDLKQAVKDLREKGVKFEEYDIPEIELKTEDGIATYEEGGKKMMNAWFKDPDGNIFSLMEV